MKKSATTFWIFVGVLVYFLAAWIESDLTIVGHSVPRQWGEYRGAVAGDLMFEDANGTIRIVDHSGDLQYTIPRK
jgi:hypothetical protein